jgi:hypothetical protein
MMHTVAGVRHVAGGSVHKINVVFHTRRACRMAQCLMMRCGVWALHSCRMMELSSCGSQVRCGLRHKTSGVDTGVMFIKV